MCGILFQLALHGVPLLDDLQFGRMLDTLAHRGPDGRTIFRRGRVLMGHRRLSIIDLAGGTQPLFNEDHSIACILNGEIYNYRQLRAQLLQAGHGFRTDSDTEVLVHLYEEHGDDFLRHIDGMFTIALADFRKDRYLLARDRLGEKSLYYSAQAGRFTCASEARALIADPDYQARVEQTELVHYLRRGYTSGQASIWSGVQKLGPGECLTIEGGRIGAPRRYWLPQRISRRISWRDAVAETTAALERAMQNKMVADVPVGVFLSGGLDSSVVTALAARTTGQRLQTFSVGFNGAHSELEFAREVARRYDTEHVELDVSLDLERDLPEVFGAYDEPFFDSSSLPTLLICREAARHVKVVLTGDGGDELFAGYSAYLDQAAQYRSRLLSAAARRLRHRFEGTGIADTALGLPCARPSITDSLHRWRELGSVFSQAQVHGLLGGAVASLSQAQEPAGLYCDIATPLGVALQDDLTTGLPDQLLVKVDRASMANGIECRAPLLDHHLVEYALTLPPELLLHKGVTKALFRAAARDLLPESILKREKQGFGSPLRTWMAGQLNASVRALGSDQSSLRSILDASYLERLVPELLGALDTDWRAPLRLWTLLALEGWADQHLFSGTRRSSVQ
jgi:asparagine synthase (glutamine-hydrolysing)